MTCIMIYTASQHVCLCMYLICVYTCVYIHVCQCIYASIYTYVCSYLAEFEI